MPRGIKQPGLGRVLQGMGMNSITCWNAAVGGWVGGGGGSEVVDVPLLGSGWS